MKQPNRKKRPNTTTGKIRALLALGPVDSRKIADQFGLTVSRASAFLSQMGRRGEAVRLTEGKCGCCPVHAKWGEAR